MITTAITKTKEQINKKREEIARLELETQLLEVRLLEQERLLREFDEAKKVLEEKAQALIDSQSFDYDDVKQECSNLKLTQEITQPAGVQFVSNVDRATNTISYGEIFKESQNRMDLLGEKIDNGEVSKKDAAITLLGELNKMIEITSLKNNATGIKPPRKETSTTNSDLQPAILIKQ